uniref:Uncharacterized protein n=1 Tax=Ornithorhynchus anatinus TaxID=9258 RepID=F6UHY5_ORNAN
MVPLSVVDLLLQDLDLDGARAHVQQQVEVTVQHLDGEEVHLDHLRVLGVLLVAGLAVAEEDQPVGLRGAEIERYGARLLGVPLGQGDEGLRGLERDGVQGGHVLALEGHHAVDLHLGVALLGEAGELQPDVVVLVDHLQAESGCQPGRRKPAVGRGRLS